MQVIERDIEELIESEENPRQLSESEHAQIEASLKRFGMAEPIIVNVHADRSNIIIGGHQRMRIWRNLGNRTIPCVELELDKAQERELCIRLNRNSGSWDWDLLANHFDTGDLVEWGFGEGELGAWGVDAVQAPELADGDRAPFRQATFTLHDEQWEELEAALAKAKGDGGGESAINENGNGNALAWICGRFNRG